MSSEDKQAFVAAVDREHGQRLRRFLARRLRNAAGDVPDLIQEIYLRMLRIPQEKSIRSPQAYLFTVAFHVLHQHKLTLADAPETVDPLAMAEIEAPTANDPSERFENSSRLRQIDRVLQQLPRNAYVAFVLHRRYGFTLEEIAARMGVSRAMIKKHLARAVAHCRAHMQELE